MAAEGSVVDADIRRAQTLPPQAFTDPAWLERELATIFRTAWLLLPQRGALEAREDPSTLAQRVTRRGDRAPFALLDRPLFLQRDWEGTLRCFPNVCTHAWHTLVPGPSRERTITCPQHGRQFDTAGRCVMQPGFEGTPDFPGAEDHLPAMPVEAWGELLFACLGKPAMPLDAALGPVRESLGKLSLGPMRWRPQPDEVREVEGNWKQHAWNYLDALHIPYVHRKPGGLADAVDLASYRTELHPWGALQWAYAKDPAHGFEPALLPPRFGAPGKAVFALWWFVWPNLALNFYPWGLSVNAYMPVPGQPQRTLFLWHHFVLDDARYAQRERIWMLRAVDDEDVDALRQVSRGVRSGFARRGRFAPSEVGPHWFHRLVAEQIARAPGA